MKTRFDFIPPQLNLLQICGTMCYPRKRPKKEGLKAVEIDQLILIRTDWVVWLGFHNLKN